MKIKAVFIIIFSCVLYTFSQAQPYILNEILQFHNAQPNYSARSAAVGGAFTSLGADVINLYQNPAGIGMYRSTEIFYGPGLSFKNINSNLIGSQNNNTNFLFEGGTGGIVLTVNRDYPKLKYINFGFAFHNSKSNNLTKYYTGTHEFTNDYGETIVLDLEETIENKKSRYREFAFAVAANYNNKFFIGLNITSPRYDYNQKFEYSEFDATNTIVNFNEYLYDETDSLEAVRGINIGIGLLYNINNNFRVGLNAKSASRIDVLQTNFFSEVIIDDFGEAEAIASDYSDSIAYTLITAPQFNAGISYLNQKGFVAIDVGYVINERFSYEDDDEYNQLFSDFLKNSIIFRVGGEFILTQNLKLRAGYNLTTSPLQNNEDHTANQNISLGAGFRKAVFVTESSSRTIFADATLKYRFYQSQYNIDYLENGPFVDFKYNQLHC